MKNTKPNNVVRKLDPDQLAEHHANLDAAYRWLQKAYKAMTYEQGRLEDEPGLEVLGAPAADRLGNLAGRLEKLGVELKGFVLEGVENDVSEESGKARK